MSDKVVEVAEQEINLLELVYVVVKRKMVVIAMCAIAMIGSAAVSLALPQIYSATAKILPPQKESGGGISALLGQAGGGLAALAGGLGGTTDLYLGILNSRSVAEGVARRLDLQKHYQAKSFDDARARAGKVLKVQSGKDGIISVTAEDKDPKWAALLANTFVDELGRTTVRLNLTKAGTERVFLEKRLDVVRKDLRMAEDNLKVFSEQNRIVQVDSQAKATIETVARLKAELASKEVQLSAIRSNQTDENPEVRAAEAAIEKLKRQIGGLAGGSGDAEGIPSVGKVPSVGLEYARRLREVKTQEAISEQLTKQYEMAKLSEAKDSSSLQILDEAIPPKTKSKPKKALIIAASTTAAFFVSLFFVFLLEFIEKMSDDDRAILEKIKKKMLALS